MLAQTKIKEAKQIEHINMEAMIVGSLTKDLAPMLFNEHVIFMGARNSFDLLDSGSIFVMIFYML